MGRSGVPTFTPCRRNASRSRLQVAKKTETSTTLHGQWHLRLYELWVLMPSSVLGRRAVLGLDFLLKRGLDSRFNVAGVKVAAAGHSAGRHKLAAFRSSASRLERTRHVHHCYRVASDALGSP